MGNTDSKFRLTDFATMYLDRIRNNPISNIPSISQIHHLMLFVSEDGEKYYFNENCTYIVKDNEREILFMRPLFKCLRTSRCLLHCLYYLCVYYLRIEPTHEPIHEKYYINVFCNELNTFLKQEAIRLLEKYPHIDVMDLQNKLVEYETTLESVKQKLTTSNIADSNELLLEGYNIQKNIDEINKQIADANVQNEIRRKYERFIEIIKVEQPDELVRQVHKHPDAKNVNTRDNVGEMELLLKNE